MTKTMTAHKYDISFTSEWWNYHYFKHRIEDFISSPCLLPFRYLETVNDIYLSLSHIPYIRYQGEYEILIDELGNIKEIGKVVETK